MKKYILLFVFFFLLSAVKAESYIIRFEKTTVDLTIGDDVNDYLPIANVSNGTSIVPTTKIDYQYGKWGLTLADIDTSIPTEYSLFCEAICLDYKVSCITRIDFIVHDYEAPVISGPEVLKKRYDEEIDVYDYIKVIDDSSIEPEVDYDKKDVFNIVGNHTITFTATDSVGNKDIKSIELIVFDDVAPIIECDDISLCVNDQLQIEDFAKATDAYYGEIDVLCDAIDTSKIGTQEIELSSSDIMENKATKKVLVSIYDKEKPTIELTSRNLYVNEKYDLKENISKVTDNYDSLVISDVTISTQKLGNGYYEAIYSLEDNSGNITVEKAFIHYTYNDSPVISLVDSNIDKTNFDPLKYVTAFDEKDGDISNRIVVSDVNLDDGYCIYDVYDIDGNYTRLVLNFAEEKVSSNDKPVVPVANEIEEPVAKVNTVTQKTKTNYWIYIGIGALVLGAISFKIIRHFRKKMV